MKMWVGLHLSIFAFCVVKYATSSCKIRDNYIEYSDIFLDIDKPIQTKEEYCLYHMENYTEVNLKIQELYMNSVRGSIGIETISSFLEAEKLSIYSSQINNVENGTFCFLPNVKTLEILNSNFIYNNLLEKRHFSDCNHIENFECETPLARDALEEMTALKKLSLTGVDSSYIRDYLAPLNQIESLSLDITNVGGYEPGLFCTQPSLKKLTLRTRTAISLDEFFFYSCKNLKSIHVEGDGAVLLQGLHQFSNNVHLENMRFHPCIVNYLAKQELNAFPNLKTLEILGDNNCRLHIGEDAFVNTSKLTRLTLSHVHLEDSKLDFLQNLTNLVTLDLSNNEIHNPNAIPSLPSLTILYMPRNKIVRFDLDVFREKFPSLQWLFIGNNPLNAVFKKQLFDETTFSVFN